MEETIALAPGRFHEYTRFHQSVYGLDCCRLRRLDEVARASHRDNWVARNLKPAAEKAGLGPVNFQVLRRTFATVIQKHGTIKDAQAQLRHASPDLTLRTYMQAIPESVQEAVDSLERELTKPPGGDTIQ